MIDKLFIILYNINIVRYFYIYDHRNPNYKLNLIVLLRWLFY
nr:MAG TPA: hypothetical protein [Caudoviricetes sp.]